MDCERFGKAATTGLCGRVSLRTNQPEAGETKGTQSKHHGQDEEGKEDEPKGENDVFNGKEVGDSRKRCYRGDEHS